MIGYQKLAINQTPYVTQ